MGIDPPPSVHPRLSDGTAITRSDAMARLSAIPRLTLPKDDLLPAVYPLDLGPLTGRGVGTFPAHACGPAYPCLVPALDADGNEVGAVRMPDVEVPVATHTGFNVRAPRSGGMGQLLEYVGLTLPFARDATERARSGDPRPAIAERYAGREDYLTRVRASAERLVSERLLLNEDVELCVDLAAERYDACMAWPR